MDGQKVEPPEISYAEECEVREQLSAALAPLLEARGLSDEEVANALTSARGRLSLVPRTSGPEIRLTTLYGAVPVSPRALGQLADELRTAAEVQRSGPDPLPLAIRAVRGATGALEEDVRALLTGRLRRDPDGAVVLTLPRTTQDSYASPAEGQIEYRDSHAFDRAVRWAIAKLEREVSPEAVAAKRASGYSI